MQIERSIEARNPSVAPPSPSKGVEAAGKGLSPKSGVGLEPIRVGESQNMRFTVTASAVERYL